MKNKVKKCASCAKEFTGSLTASFYRDTSRHDMLDSYCKKCSDKKRAERRKRRNAAIRNSVVSIRQKLKSSSRRKAKSYYDGKVFKCAVVRCGRKSEDLHHIDYSRPLEVIPLCKRHHKNVHQEHWKD